MKAKNMTIAALALLLAACGNEEILENNESGSTGKVHMTFTAGTPQTRTSLGEDGHAVNWTQGDLVAIYDGTETICKFEATEVSGSTATLKGEAAETDTYTAFYPYTDDGTLTLDNTAITFTLPATQTATAGGFAEGLNPSWAQATGGSKNLEFQNLCALAKFTVDAEGVTEVTLTANQESDALAGGLTYTIADGTLTATGSASRSVTIKGNFEAAKEYYFVVAPGTLTGGITLNYMGDGGKTYVKTTTNQVTFAAGKITYLGALDIANFTEALNAAFANAVKESKPDIQWRANPDGTVSLDEYNRIEIINNGGTFLDLPNKNITSLAGIEYFTDLETLNCAGNQLTTLDVTKLTNLELLDCRGNQLTTLDVTKLTSLMFLVCNDNQLTTLDVTGLTSLVDLFCSGNQLTALDVTGLTNLTSLHCNGNQLVSLDISTLEKLEILWCHGNKMTALDITHNADLWDLECGNQQDNQQLTLTLWDTKKEFWDRMLDMYSDENSNVTTIVIETPVNADHDGYEEDGGEPVLQ
ncbi:leucine-rich repeat domain-containing protein [Bacteroides caecigallinarum]|uniref:leucine-rich repeat domain-containing protein n=1 Tax=Bacteroides caecigallinarum TaxID=1411144 RepID=UPI001F323D1D|nr:leucine-rich repeat domain-containing protein [Bacteroides caecigallinarum]MCF2551579.1 leucine-rich repeat domain-containing protein [Bacteroides caecigallinarum]